MRIAVIGAGAMGALYGGLLARSGQQVTLVWALPFKLGQGSQVVRGL